MREYVVGWLKSLAGKVIEGYVNGNGKPPEKVGPAEIDKSIKVLSDILHNRIGLGPEIVHVLTYASAVEYFIKSRPQHGNVNRGAMLIEPHAKGTLFTQIFLDSNLEPVLDATGAPVGRKVVARALDAELQEKFGDKQMVLVG